MVDVNLLPEEMRDKEEKEKKAISKKPRVFEVKMSAPQPEKPSARKEPQLPKSFFPRSPKQPPEETGGKQDESGLPGGISYRRKQKLHIPESQSGAVYGGEVNLLKSEQDESKTAEPEIMPEISGENLKIRREVLQEIEKELESEPPAIEEISPPEIRKVERKKKRGFFDWLKSLFSGKKKSEEQTPKIEKKAIDGLSIPALDIGRKEAKKEIFEKEEITKSKKEKKPRTGFFAWLKSLFGKKKKEQKKPTIIFPPQKTAVSEPIDGDKPEKKAEIFGERPAETAGQKIQEPKAPKPVYQAVPVAPIKLSFGEKDNGAKKNGNGKIKPSRNLEINLIPDELTSRPQMFLLKKAIIAGLVLLLSFGAVFFIKQAIIWYELRIGNQIMEAEKRISELNDKIAGYEKVRSESAHLKNTLDAVENLLSKHLYWTKIFSALEKHTIDDVYFTSFTSSEQGDLILSAVGKDYESVARQLVAFENAKDFARDVSIASASAVLDSENRGIQNVNFNINIRLIPEIYYIKFLYQN